jgi:hypothetical protein
MQYKIFAAGIATLAFVVVSAPAQVRITPSFRANAPISITVTPEARLARAIADLPYSGDRTSERILSDGTHMSQSIVREFRDSAGRTREEHSGQGFGSMTITEIVDPDAGIDWILDPANQVVHRLVLHLESRPGRRDLYPCEPAGSPTSQTMANGNVATSQQLGSQMMEGIQACGRRTNMTQKDGTPGITTEMWTSRGDIGGILLNKSSDLTGGNNVWQLVNVQFGEPNPGLFEPPAQFKVVNETAAFTITEPASVSQVPPVAPAPANRTFIALTGMPWSGDVMNGSTLLTTQMRDSMGRTRREPHTGSTVMIVDPVAGYSYTLDTAAHTLHRRSITVQSKPASEAAPAATVSQTQNMASGVIARTESLGTRTINGVVTFGTRVTLTYPPGTERGNDKTTSTVNEAWVSPQLGAAVLMQNSGAMVPTFTDRLINIKYAEPDPALFRIPNGYHVIDDQ